MDLDEARRRLREARVGRLATVRPDGSPHVVPFAYAIVETGEELTAYWAVDDKPKRSRAIGRLENIRANPAVEFVVDGFDEDWAKLWWVRSTGRARIVASDDEREIAIEELRDKYPQYRTQPFAGPVVAIDIDRVSSWFADPSR
jgi:PPOX class probable F420-dependent enzyme